MWMASTYGLCYEFGKAAFSSTRVFHRIMVRNLIIQAIVIYTILARISKPRHIKSVLLPKAYIGYVWFQLQDVALLFQNKR